MPDYTVFEEGPLTEPPVTLKAGLLRSGGSTLEIVETNITLDVYNYDTTPSTVKAIALDSNTRYVAAALQNANKIYDLPSSATVELYVRRPDNTGVQISGTTYTYDGDGGTQVYGAYAELTQLALAIKGACAAQFKITVGEQILRTEVFTVSVGQALDADIESWAGDLDGHNLDEMAESIETLESAVGTLQTDVATVKEDLLELQEGGYVADQQRIEEKIDAWLDDHPEATTTVQDGTITPSKLANSLRLKASIQLDGMTYGDAIQLPIAKSYLEGVTYLDGRYYCVCRDYTNNPNSTYIVIYDNSFSVVTYKYTDSTYGTANNISNDGENIYVDYDNGYHVIFDKNIENDVVVMDSSFRNVSYDDALYGIAINLNDVTVYSLNSSLVVIDTVCVVAAERQTLQSAQIIGGILYISTTKGIFHFIDINRSEILAKIPYYSSKEIECFFKDADGEVKCAGHFYGTNGIFNVGTFVDGIEYPEMSYAPIDASHGNTNLWAGERYGFYKITNGLLAGLPADTGDLLILDSARLMFSWANDAIYAYNKGAETWLRVGGLKRSFANVAITIGNKTVSDAMRVERIGATVSARLMYQKADGTSHVSSGTVIGTIPDGFRPTMERWCCGIARDASAWQNANYYPISIRIQANGDVSVWGNEAKITSAIYIWFADSYITM